jgi:DNA processing protein
MELRYWLALLRTPHVGCITFNLLLDKFRTPESLFAEPPKALAKLGLTEQTIAYLQSPDWKRIERDLTWLEQPDHDCLTIQDGRYPALLKEIPDPPPLLFIRGDTRALTSVPLAVVGSRNPSHHGKQIAHDFAKSLVGAGLSITSGLAIGIDAASHLGALDGDGVTVAVAGTGLDQIYPIQHANLADRIMQNRGVLVSEFPPETAPRAKNFPRFERGHSGRGSCAKERFTHHRTIGPRTRSRRVCNTGLNQ